MSEKYILKQNPFQGYGLYCAGMIDSFLLHPWRISYYFRYLNHQKIFKRRRNVTNAIFAI